MIIAIAAVILSGALAVPKMEPKLVSVRSK